MALQTKIELEGAFNSIRVIERTKRARWMISFVRMKTNDRVAIGDVNLMNTANSSEHCFASVSITVSRVLPYTQFYLRPDKFAVNNDRRAIVNHRAQQMVFLHGNSTFSAINERVSVQCIDILSKGIINS